MRCFNNDVPAAEEDKDAEAEEEEEEEEEEQEEAEEVVDGSPLPTAAELPPAGDEVAAEAAGSEQRAP